MRLTGLGFLIIFFCSCSQKEENIPQSEPYFNIKNYFEKEADRLTKLSLIVHKTVSIDGVSEQKRVKISDYKKELNTFISSDINKASWRGAFTVKKEEDQTFFTTENEKVPVKKVHIRFKNNSVKSIQIIVQTTNILYHSADTLTYFPDSLYEIKKTQKIKLLKEKKYVVIGRFTSN